VIAIGGEYPECHYVDAVSPWTEYMNIAAKEFNNVSCISKQAVMILCAFIDIKALTDSE
jgi:hypothetical protein